MTTISLAEAKAKLSELVEAPTSMVGRYAPATLSTWRRRKTPAGCFGP